MNRRPPMARGPRNPGPRMPGPNSRKPGHYPYYPWCWYDWYYDDWYDWEYDWDWEYDYDWMDEGRAGRRHSRGPRKNRMGNVLHLEAPLVMSLFEYVKNQNPSEMEMQHMVSRMLALCEYGEVLGPEYYDQIVPTNTTPMDKKE